MERCAVASFAVVLAAMAAVMGVATAQDFDSRQLYEVSVIPGAQVESTGTFTTSAVGECNNCVETVALDFNFTYYGNTFSDMILASNGWMTFDLSQTGTPGPGGGVIPGTGYPPDTIALVGTNMAPSIFNIGRVVYRVEGSAPNRVFVVYHDGRTYNNNISPDNINAQLKIYESTNIVEFHYFSNGGNFTFSQEKSAGIQDTSQGQGHMAWRQTGTGGPPNNTLVRYDPNPKVVSFERQSTVNPVRSGDTPIYRLTFDRPVTTPFQADFVLVEGGGASGSVIGGISPVPGTEAPFGVTGHRSFDIPVTVGTAPALGGTVGLRLADANQSITAQGTGRIQPASFTFDSEVFDIDNDPPAILIGAPIPSVGTSATNFDFPVSIVDAATSAMTESDVTVTPSGTGAGTVTVLNGGSFNPTIRVSGVTGDGSFTVSIGPGIAEDSLGNVSVASAPSPAASVANSAPGVGIGAPTPAIGNASTNFDFPVTVINAATVNLNLGGITITPSGVTIGTAQVLDGNSFNPTVRVSGVTGEGSFEVAINAGIAQNALAEPSLASAPSPAATVDNTPPGIDVSAPSVNQASTGPVSFTVSYTGADIVTLAEPDVTLFATGTANASISVSGSGTAARTVTLSGITGDGSLSITVAAGTAADLAGNLAGFAASPDVFTVKNSPPAAPIITNDGGNGPGQNFITSNQTVLLTGTVEFGVSQVLLNGNTIAYTPGDSVWSVPVNLTALGPVANLSVVARDAFGNESSPATIVISYEAASGDGDGDGDGDGFPPAPPGSPIAGPAGLASLAALLAGAAALRVRRKSNIELAHPDQH